MKGSFYAGSKRGPAIESERTAGSTLNSPVPCPVNGAQPNQRKIDAFEELKKSLLHQAFSGNL